MIPASFEYESPRELTEVLALLASREDVKLLAGGHSLLPAMKLRLAAPAMLVDLSRIPGLSYIREVGDTVRIGAMTTHADVASSSLLHRASPLLAQAAREIGDVQVRNRGTIGGSLAHADPSADYPAAVLALDAEIVAMSVRGERTLAARDFFSGLFTTALAADEVITEVRVPVTAPAATAYKKFAHPASGMAVVGVAVVLKARGTNIDSAAIGITGVGQYGYRASAVEANLRGKPGTAIPAACDFVTDGIDVLSDYFASAEYRSHLVRVYTRRALQECLAPHKK